MRRPLATSLLLLGSVVGCTSSSSSDGEQHGSRALPITGGAEFADEGSTVLVEVDHDAAAFVCSGTLLLPDLVLTAAHCASGLTGAVDCASTTLPPALDVDAFRVTAGADLSSTPPIDFPFVKVRAIHLATDAGALLCGNDLALLELEMPLAHVVVPAAAEMLVAPSSGESITAMGYGAQHASGTGERVRRARDLSVLCSGSDCEGIDVGAAGSPSTSAPPVLAHEFLASDGPCAGDSGGPALRGGKVVGVLSRGLDGCRAPVFVSIDERVAALVRLHAEATDQAIPTWALEHGPSDEQGDPNGGGADGSGIEGEIAGASNSDVNGEPASGCTLGGSPFGSNTAFAGMLLLATALLRRRVR